MVEVTRSNFSSVFPLVENSIKNSTFIAIDTEFTGLSLGPSNDNNIFDSLSKRYEKLRCRATSFVPCQIGLSTFSKDLDKNSYSAETFVFYIRPCMVGTVDRIFSFQASSVDFLCGYNFDFKKFISEGIPYLNENQEARVRQQLEGGSISVPHEKLLDLRYQQKVSDMIDKKFGSFTRTKKFVGFSNEKLVLPIDPKCHVYFQLREIRRKYSKLWAYSKEDSIVVEMVSDKKKRELESYEKEEQERVLDYFLGFTKVFRLLKSCQKPIVGHNFLMDLMLFYQNFHKNLPVSYYAFKEELHTIFPVIYDTKHMWANIKQVLEGKRFPIGISLVALYELFRNPPDHLNTLFSPCILPSNCKHYIDQDFVHDSGYDAFITGFVFLKICHLLAMESPSPLIPKDNPPTFKHLLSAASLFVNKVNFIYFPIRYINLEGEDPLPEPTRYLYVCPKDGNGSMTLDQFNFYVSRYQISEFKFTKLRRGAKVAIKNIGVYNRILKDFKDDPDLIVERYNFLRHSPTISTTLWLTGLASSVLVSVWIWKSS